MVRSSPNRPATLWHCAATGELRESPTGPAFWGYESYVTDNDPTGVRLHIVPQSSTVDVVRRKLGGGETQPLIRLRPTGAVVSEDGKSWEEHEVEWPGRSFR